MPRGQSLRVEQEAVAIIRREEQMRGWNPEPQLGKAQERLEGCDFFSRPPGGGDAHPIEVKGWGAPLIQDGKFTDAVDINAEQAARAERDDRWRLEIVGNLTAWLAGTGHPQRLTLTAVEVRETKKCWRFRIALQGFETRVRPPVGEDVEVRNLIDRATEEEMFRDAAEEDRARQEQLRGSEEMAEQPATSLAYRSSTTAI